MTVTPQAVPRPCCFSTCPPLFVQPSHSPPDLLFNSRDAFKRTQAAQNQSALGPGWFVPSQGSAGGQELSLCPARGGCVAPAACPHPGEMELGCRRQGRVLSTQGWQSCTSLLPWYLCCCSGGEPWDTSRPLWGPRAGGGGGGEGGGYTEYSTQEPVCAGSVKGFTDFCSPGQQLLHADITLKQIICLHGNPDSWKTFCGLAGHYSWTIGTQFGKVLSLLGEIPPKVVTHTALNAHSSCPVFILWGSSCQA